ncbi:glutamate dehydrogenase [Rhodococcus sp. WMMA185]|uniref:Glu/Leu/Phe/Val family dehydrogenase n=1 Tax=Rhodococcus sp. WMMA185 TaxID=679318 RepID=UPI000878F1A2|nr:Glu/Leu/Phe/Val dehydrogenase dimerization domain-containing protein [Rhodococcus sp. WMMA185]AOW92058.1 glutamate dehydrogenase [Rhodococcus sp. WMMA185]
MQDLFPDIDEWGPEKVVVVSDAKTGMKGVLVIDNSARGMGKGGTRMSPTLTVGEVARLARVMTWKWATNDLFFGGAKAGILGDPAGPNKEAVLRAFARKLSNEVPREYVFGLDMGLTENDAAIIQDELGDRGAAVGVPAVLGGIPYDELGVTGHGVAEAAMTILDIHDLETAQASFAIQGLGAVGAATAKRLAEEGATIVAVSTSKGALLDPGGLDIPALLALRATYGDACVEHYGIPTSPLGAELTTNADVLIPAATQDVVDVDLVSAIKARFIVEGANLPISTDALDLLHSRDVPVVPDFIANSGGTIAASYSMDARYSPFRPDLAAVFRTTSEKISANVRTVAEKSSAERLTPHRAARALAQDRVRQAMLLRAGRGHDLR